MGREKGFWLIRRVALGWVTDIMESMLGRAVAKGSEGAKGVLFYEGVVGSRNEFHGRG